MPKDSHGVEGVGNWPEITTSHGHPGTSKSIPSLNGYQAYPSGQIGSSSPSYPHNIGVLPQSHNYIGWGVAESLQATVGNNGSPRPPSSSSQHSLPGQSMSGHYTNAYGVCVQYSQPVQQGQSLPTAYEYQQQQQAAIHGMVYANAYATAPAHMQIHLGQQHNHQYKHQRYQQHQQHQQHQHQQHQQPPPPPPPPQQPQRSLQHGTKRPRDAVTEVAKPAAPKQSRQTKTKPKQEPDTTVYTCEACDKTMKGKSAFDAHCAQHEVCSEEGCSFRATRKVLAVHFQTVHGQFAGTGMKKIEVDGQSFSVLLGTVPEEVRMWREARRAKFPSTQRIREKLDRQQKLCDAGGLTAPSSSSSLSSSSAGAAATSQGDARASEPEKSSSAHQMGSEAEPSATSATAAAAATTAATPPVTVKKRLCSYFLKRGACRHGDACRFSHIIPEGGVPRKHNSSKLILPPPLAGGTRGTLLRSLLKTEIDSEENLLLQCISHLCKTDFLGQNTEKQIKTDL